VSYDGAFRAFNLNTNTRSLTKGFDVVLSRASSKKNKRDLTQLKNHVYKLKQESLKEMTNLDDDDDTNKAEDDALE
jgi:hypothetical protein